jgi:hypothetical protein
MLVSMGKSLALAIILILVASSLIIVESAYAQSIPKPSIPEFSLNVVSHPYDVPTTYATSTPNPYTGKTELFITKMGYHVENKSIELTIKNQPFTSTLDASGNYTSLYYNVKFKGHHTAEWNYWPTVGSGLPYTDASKSDYTVINFTLGTNPTNGFFWDVPVNGQEDFQVQAMIGHDNKYAYVINAESPNAYTAYSYIFKGQSSDWSNLQTITIGETAELPTPSPTVPELPLVSVIFLLVIVSISLVYFKRRKGSP